MAHCYRHPKLLYILTMKFGGNLLKNSASFLALCLLCSCQQASGSGSSGGTASSVPAIPITSVAGDSAGNSGGNFFPVTAYGASTASSDNTAAIQNAINAAKAYGTAALPGIVVLAGGGTYLSGPLTLYGNVFLKIDSGTTLKALPMASYAATYSVTLGSTGSSIKNNFISASNASNLGVYGSGTLDGNGGNGASSYATFSADTTSWWGYYLANKGNSGFSDPRPRMLYFTNCSNLYLRGITVQNSPSMHIMTSGGSTIVLEGLTVQSPAKSTVGDKGNGTTGDAPNTDGFDPGGNGNYSSSGIWVDNCSFDTGDDCIAVKAASTDSGNTVAVSKLYITNCTFLHGHGLSFGGQTEYGIGNVQVDGCSFYGTQYGIKIKSPRGTGGEVSTISYTNLNMTNVGKPIWFTAYYPDSSNPGLNTAETSTYSYSQYGTPYYHDITVQNLSITGTVSGAVTQMGEILGLPEKPFVNLVLENISLSAAGTTPSGLWVREAAVRSIGNTCPSPVVDTQGGSVSGN